MYSFQDIIIKNTSLELFKQCNFSRPEKLANRLKLIFHSFEVTSAQTEKVIMYVGLRSEKHN